MTINQLLVATKNTKAGLAKKIGCSRSYISRLCAGKREFTVSVLKSIARVTDTELSFKNNRPEFTAKPQPAEAGAK